MLPSEKLQKRYRSPKLKKLFENVLNYLEDDDIDSEEFSHVRLDSDLESDAFQKIKHSVEIKKCVCNQAVENEKLMKKMNRLEREVRIQKLFISDLIDALYKKIKVIQKRKIELSAQLSKNENKEGQENDITKDDNSIEISNFICKKAVSNCKECGADFVVYNGDWQLSYDLHIQTISHQLAVWKPIKRSISSYLTEGETKTLLDCANAESDSERKESPREADNFQNKKLDDFVKDGPGAEIQTNSGDLILDTVLSIVCSPSVYRKQQLQLSQSDHKEYLCFVCKIYIPSSCVNCTEHLTSRNHISKMGNNMNSTQKGNCLKDLYDRFHKCEFELLNIDESIFLPFQLRVRNLAVKALGKGKKSISNSKEYQEICKRKNNIKKIKHLKQKTERVSLQNSHPEADKTDNYDYVFETIRTCLKASEVFKISSDKLECCTCNAFCPTGPQNFITHMVQEDHIKIICEGMEFDQKREFFEDLRNRLDHCEKEIIIIEKKDLKNTSLLVNMILSLLGVAKKLLKSQEQTSLNATVKLSCEENIDIYDKVDLDETSLEEEKNDAKDVDIKDISLPLTELQSADEVTFKNDITDQLLGTHYYEFFGEENIVSNVLLLDAGMDLALKEKMKDVFGFDVSNVYVNISGVVSCLACPFIGNYSAFPAVTVLKHLISANHLIRLCRNMTLTCKREYIRTFCEKLETLCESENTNEYLYRSNCHDYVWRVISYLQVEVAMLKELHSLFWTCISKLKFIHETKSYQEGDTIPLLCTISDYCYICQINSYANVRKLNIELRKLYEYISKICSTLFYSEVAEIQLWTASGIYRTEMRLSQFSFSQGQLA